MSSLFRLYVSFAIHREKKWADVEPSIERTLRTGLDAETLRCTFPQGGSSKIDGERIRITSILDLNVCHENENRLSLSKSAFSSCALRSCRVSYI
jgi:hypothetical protein